MWYIPVCRWTGMLCVCSGRRRSDTASSGRRGTHCNRSLDSAQSVHTCRSRCGRPVYRYNIHYIIKINYILVSEANLIKHTNNLTYINYFFIKIRSSIHKLIKFKILVKHYLSGQIKGLSLYKPLCWHHWILSKNSYKLKSFNSWCTS